MHLFLSKFSVRLYEIVCNDKNNLPWRLSQFLFVWRYLGTKPCFGPGCGSADHFFRPHSRWVLLSFPIIIFACGCNQFSPCVNFLTSGSQFWWIVAKNCGVLFCFWNIFWMYVLLQFHVGVEQWPNGTRTVGTTNSGNSISWQFQNLALFYSLAS